MADGSFLRGAARALAAAPLALVAVTTALVALGFAAGMVGIPVLLIAASWIWAYAYLLVVATAHGLPLPVLAVEDANPWHEPRPLLPLALLAVAAMVAWWLDQRLGPWAAAAMGLLTLLAFPASLALLAVEGEVLRAASPLAIARVAAVLGTHYLWLFALGVAYGAILVALAPGLPRIATVAIAQLLLFSLCTALGTALYAHRHELGLEAWNTPERDTERAARETERDRAALAEELYGLIRARRPEAAWTRAAAWLHHAGRDPSVYRWLRDRALSWGDGRFADRLGDELVARLIALGRRAEALAEVEACWRRGGRYTACDYRDRDVLEGVARELGRDAALERLRSLNGRAREPR